MKCKGSVSIFLEYDCFVLSSVWLFPALNSSGCGYIYTSKHLHTCSTECFGVNKTVDQECIVVSDTNPKSKTAPASSIKYNFSMYMHKFFFIHPVSISLPCTEQK